MNLLRTCQMFRTLGPGWAFYRAGYELRRRTGRLKARFPAGDAAPRQLADLVLPGTPHEPADYKTFHEQHGGKFLFPFGTPPRNEIAHVIDSVGRARTIQIADDYCRGRFLYFSTQSHDHGWPPDWLLNPETGNSHHARTHWCDYPTFSNELGDIKDVWEPSRFACAFWLARAYTLAGDEKYSAAFWTLFESWAIQNPPNLGPNWKCGQETAIRIFGWCFALWVFWNSPETTAQRVAAMAHLLAIQADRVFHNIDFAISQNNNHSMSEAVGLLTVGLLFPEFKDAEKWTARGMEVLESDAQRLIYDDGSFVQNSMNYHRVMLHDCLWAIRITDLNDRPLSDELKRRIRLAGEFLFETMDDSQGAVPNYGPNDGALVLPLDACGYDDFRPTVQACTVMLENKRAFPPGPWDESALWLCGTLPDARATHQPSSRRFDAGGYYTLRRADSWAMMRCHTFRDRPSHVDMLHLDLWHRGVNVLSDSGSYKYFTPESPGLDKFFKDIAAHNTIELDRRGPLELVSRFMWLPWPKAKIISHEPTRMIGVHYAYHRSPWHVVHRRSVESADDGTWHVTDELLGTGAHDVLLRWNTAPGHAGLLPDGMSLDHGAAQMTLRITAPQPLQFEIQQGLDDGHRYAGWIAAHYRERIARPCLCASARLTLPTTLTTRIVFADKKA